MRRVTSSVAGEVAQGMLRRRGPFPCRQAILGARPRLPTRYSLADNVQYVPSCGDLYCVLCYTRGAARLADGAMYFACILVCARPLIRRCTLCSCLCCVPVLSVSTVVQCWLQGTSAVR